MIVIVNYGLGNLGSVLNMFKRIGAPAKITSDPEEIATAEKILLPGVGAFDVAMKKIHEAGFFTILNTLALEKKIPILGICLGMQLLTDRSDEGYMEGFHWIPGTTRKFTFPEDSGLKIPHMGWNEVTEKNPSQLTAGLPFGSRFYFVHSYFVKTDHPSHSVMTTTYGHEFDCVIQSGNIYGAQFHPEKSHKFGMQLLQNFARI